MRKYVAILMTFWAAAACKSVQTNDSVVQQEPEVINSKDSTVIVKAGEIYAAGDFKRTILGDHYRDVWTAPIEVPIVNIKTEKGGFEILEPGGGMQTKSLKLKAADGKLYSFRSIQKDPSPVLPKILRTTIADDLFQDQISAEHPYGAFILPILGEAAGIYHTNPKLFYLPDTPDLSEYQEDFGGMLVMLEEDADEDWSDYKYFGYTENAVSSETVMEDLMDDNDNEVDQRALLRARLFDMWIGDWDRHEGQWRWAELEKKDEKGILFRPIPEDRDNVFFKFDGALPWIVSRKWAVRKFQSFDYDVRDMAGLNFNARHFDRRFLTELSREDWIAVADTLQRRLDDQVIEAAVLQWPDTIYQLTGTEITSKLKARREKLKEFANRYYDILAKEVDIHGSDKHEYFVVERLDNERTKVTVYKSNDDEEKEKILYERIFFTDETDEVRLYGFGNADYFEVTGEVDRSIVVRIIGGEGPDKISDKSMVTGMANKTKIYDTDDNTELDLGSESRDFTTRSLDVNRYDYDDFNYDLVAPQVYFGYNIDDGIFIGGGVLIETNDFRKYEFSTRHRIVANTALKTGAYNFIYEGTYREAFKNIDVDVDLLVRAPDFVSNYFGLGNGTKKVHENEDYYEYRKDEVLLDIGFKSRFGEDNYIKFGPAYRYVDVREQENTFVTSAEANISPDAFNKTHYGGLFFEAQFTSLDNVYYPRRGVRWDVISGWYHGLMGEENDFSRIQSDLSIYYTPWLSYDFPVTLAVRIGGASNIGDYFFFQANTLGGNAGLGRPGNLRGFVRDRYAGRSIIYQNTELRISLAHFQLYILPMKFGIMGVMDHGRVFTDTENEPDVWHSGYGGGVFIQPLGRWVFTATYTTSKEDNLWNVNLGFIF